MLTVQWFTVTYCMAALLFKCNLKKAGWRLTKMAGTLRIKDGLLTEVRRQAEQGLCVPPYGQTLILQRVGF